MHFIAISHPTILKCMRQNNCNIHVPFHSVNHQSTCNRRGMHGSHCLSNFGTHMTVRGGCLGRSVRPMRSFITISDNEDNVARFRLASIIKPWGYYLFLCLLSLFVNPALSPAHSPFPQPFLHCTSSSRTGTPALSRAARSRASSLRESTIRYNIQYRYGVHIILNKISVRVTFIEKENTDCICYNSYQIENA